MSRLYGLYELFAERVGDFCYWLETWRHGPTCFLVRPEGQADALFLDYDQAHRHARELAALGVTSAVHSHWKGMTSQPSAIFSKPAPAAPRRRPSALAERLS